MALLYLLSGITIVRSDEVAVILRWGRLVGDTPGLQQHASGLLFSFPRPIDYVVRVPVKHVREISVTTLASGEYAGDRPRPCDPGLRAHRRSEHRARKHDGPLPRPRPCRMGVLRPQGGGRVARRGYCRHGSLTGRDGRRPRARRRPPRTRRHRHPPRTGRARRRPLGSGDLLAGTHPSGSSGGPGERVRRGAKRLHRRRDRQKGGPGFRRDCHPRGPGRGRFVSPACARQQRGSHLEGQGRFRSLPGACQGISGQPRSGSRAPVPRRRGKSHRRRGRRALDTAPDWRKLSRPAHHHRSDRVPPQVPRGPRRRRGD